MENGETLSGESGGVGRILIFDNGLSMHNTGAASFEGIFLQPFLRWENRLIFPLPFPSRVCIDQRWF